MRKLLTTFAAYLVLLASCQYAYGTAFGSGTRWRVDGGGGNANNGGAFDLGNGSCGTDASLGAGTAFSDLTVGGTTTQATSATLAFSSTTNGPCNFLKITGTVSGSCNNGTYEMNSQSAGTATFNAALGTAGSVCSGRFAGELNTIAAAVALNVDGNQIDIKGGQTYTLTSSITETNSVTFNGFFSTPGDCIGSVWSSSSWGNFKSSAPIITTATNSTPLFLVSGSRVNGPTTFTCVQFTNTAVTPSSAIESRAAAVVVNVDTAYFSGHAKPLDCDNSGSTFECFHVMVRNSEFKSFTTFAIGQYSDKGEYVDLWVHDGTASNGTCSSGAFCFISGAMFTMNRVATYNITGSGVGVQTGSYYQVSNSIFDKSSVSGFVGAGGADILAYFENTVFYGNGSYGLDMSNTPKNGVYFGYNNAFGGNTTADTHLVTTGVNPGTISGGNPFTSDSTGNFLPNSTANAGAVLKGNGWNYFWGASTGFGDIGLIQSQGSSGGGGGGNFGPTVQ